MNNKTVQATADPTTQASQPILQRILDRKHQEVQHMVAQLPLLSIQQQAEDVEWQTRNFIAALRSSATQPSLIAEVKRASPSQGLLKSNFDPISIAQAYERGGATCISVLTDEHFFQGSFANLLTVRQHVDLPLLCKEFIIDPYQIYMARVAGADAVLLIASVLDDQDLQEFLEIADQLSMDALVEVHTLAELDRVIALANRCPSLQLVGINNRDLTNFSIDLNTTEQLIRMRRQELTALNLAIVSESGLHTSEDLAYVSQVGATAVLMGSSLVKHADPENLVRSLLTPFHTTL